MASGFTTTPLFGGAITAPLPNGYIDASDLRQIPDNQEVFLSPTSKASLIISLLERVAATAAPNSNNNNNDDNVAQALQIHFEDGILGAENRQGANADVPLVKAVEQLRGPAGAVYEGEAKAGLLVAAMVTAEGERARLRARGEDEVVFTGVVMGIVRLRAKETDVVVEFHVPHVRGQFDESGVVLEEKQSGPLVEQAQSAVRHIIDGFKVEDWNLFGA